MLAIRKKFIKNDAYVFNVAGYVPKEVLEPMENDWVVRCAFLFGNPDIDSLSAVKEQLMYKSKHPYLRVSHFAVEEFHAFITSIPQEYRNIAMCQALGKFFRYIFRTKILISKHPVWVRNTLPKNNLILWMKFDALSNAEKKFPGIRSYLKIKHEREGDYYVRSCSKYFAPTIFSFNCLGRLAAEQVTEDIMESIGRPEGLQEMYYVIRY